MNSIVTVNNVSKSYYSGLLRKSTVEVLKNITLQVKEGEIFSLLGPNGAGKTTLMKIILGITYPTRGDIKLFNGEDTDNSGGNRIGYLPEKHQYPEKMKAREIITLFGLMRGMRGRQLQDRVTELLSLLELQDNDKPLMKYSKGMNQRLGLAVALVDYPSLLLLDEPTDGLDPVGRVHVRKLLVDLKNKGTTIFINSHLLSEVEAISDRVAILDKGGLVTVGPVSHLTSQGGYEILIKKTDAKGIDRLLGDYHLIKNEKEWRITAGNNHEMNTILAVLGKHGITIEEVRKKKTTLENYFISLVDRDESR